jgi:hypothetical protein
VERKSRDVATAMTRPAVPAAQEKAFDSVEGFCRQQP